MKQIHQMFKKIIGFLTLFPNNSDIYKIGYTQSIELAICSDINRVIMQIENNNV